MPKKGKGKKSKGKGKGKGGKKAAAKAAAAEEAEEMLKTCKKFVKLYQTQCTATGSVASQRILRDLRTCIENERPLVKFILHLQEPVRKKITPATKSSKSPSDSRDKEPLALPDGKDGAVALGPSSSVPETAPATAGPTSTTIPASAGLRLEPLVNVWWELKYRCLRCLHVWNLPQTDESIVALALFMESSLTPNLKVLELRDTQLSVWAVGRLARSLGNSQLVVLNLDYNRCVQPAVGSLCRELQRCTSLHSLSLNYCHLDSSTAEPLGSFAVTTQIKHLSLAGNSLHCEGASELMTTLVRVCEAGREGLRPPLSRLHLQDNGIDILGSKGMFEPVVFVRLLKRWLLSSAVVEDVNLDDNWIGDAGGRELVLALQERKTAGLPAIRLTATHRMSADIFASIVELGTQRKKAKRKGKKRVSKS